MIRKNCREKIARSPSTQYTYLYIAGGNAVRSVKEKFMLERILYRNDIVVCNLE